MEFQASIEMNVQWSPLEAVFSELGEGFGQVAQWSEHGERNPEPDSIWYQPAPEADDSDIVSPATAWALVWYYLMSAEDHLLGAAGVLPAGGLGSQFSSLTLSRASLEASAYAIWLLDSEVGLIERLKRSCIMEVWSCEETRKTLTSMGEFNRMGSDVAVQIEVYTEQRNEKFEWARQNNLVGPTLTAKKWCNEKPKIVDLAKRIDFPPSDEWAEDGTMDVLYRLLSGLTHSNPQIISAFRNSVAAKAGPVMAVLMAIRAYEQALRKLALVGGWDAPSLMWFSPARELLRKLGGGPRTAK